MKMVYLKNRTLTVALWIAALLVTVIVGPALGEEQMPTDASSLETMSQNCIARTAAIEVCKHLSGNAKSECIKSAKSQNPCWISDQQERQKEELKRIEEERKKRKEGNYQAEPLDERSKRKSAQAESDKQFQDEAVKNAQSWADNAQRKGAISDITWCLRLGIGMAVMGMPVIQDVTGSQIYSYSDVGAASGIGYGMEGELWPVYAPNFGLAAHANYAGGALEGSTVGSFDYGAKGYIGLEKMALIGNYTKITRTATIDNDMANYNVDLLYQGDAIYSVSRVGYGVRLGSVNDTSIELSVNTDAAKDETTTANSALAPKNATVYSVAIDANDFRISAEYGSEYPAAGYASYPFEGNISNATGTYWKFMFTWFLVNKTGKPR